MNSKIAIHLVEGFQRTWRLLLTLVFAFMSSAAWGQANCQLYSDASATIPVGASDIIFTLSWLAPNPSSVALGQKIAEFSGTAYYVGGSAPYAKCNAGVDMYLDNDTGMVAFDQAIFPWPSSSKTSRSYAPHGSPTGLGFRIDSASWVNQGETDHYYGRAGTFGGKPIFTANGYWLLDDISRIDWITPAYKSPGSIKLGVYKIDNIPAGTVIEPGVIGQIDTYSLSDAAGKVIKLFNLIINGAEVPLSGACEVQGTYVYLGSQAMTGPVGSTSNVKHFSVNLYNCPTGVALKYRVDPTFGIAPGSDNSLLALDPTTSLAQGVAVQLLYGNDSPHPLGSDVSLGTLGSSSHAIQLGARYKKIDSTVVPGKASSSATLTVDYQ